MLNQWTLNSSPLNSSVSQNQSWSVVLDDIIFDGYGLQNTNIVVSDANFWENPTTDLQTYRNPKSDWGAVIDRFYSERNIKISGTLYGSSSDDLNDRIDTLKKVLSKKEWYLDVKFNDTYRRVKATMINTDIIQRKHYDITRCKFSISFKALEPFRYNKDMDYKMRENVSTAISEDITNTWSVYSEPVINMSFKSATSVNQIILSIGTKQITINEDIVANDIIEIDSINKKVMLNNDEVDFDGWFPVLQAGVNILSMTTTGTFLMDLVVLQRKNWL